MSTLAPLIFTLLLASFLGSYHCGLMCGPIACNFRQGYSLISYHLGRLFSYSLFGAIAGGLSSSLWKTEWVWLPRVTGLLLGLGLILAGWQYAFNLPTRFNFMKHPWLRKVFSRHMRQPLLFGTLSVFLPCSWLYSFLLAAAQTQSPYAGALVMAVFWVGGLPALSILPPYLRKATENSSQRVKQLAGTLIMFAGLYSIAVHLFLPHQSY